MFESLNFHPILGGRPCIVKSRQEILDSGVLFHHDKKRMQEHGNPCCVKHATACNYQFAIDVAELTQYQSADNLFSIVSQWPTFVHCIILG